MRHILSLILCTAIFDSYATHERSEVHVALETLLSAQQPDWSPTGVYAYWDRETHNILYLGLASDLPTRFAQHNGLVRHGGGNKTEEIDDYFSRKKRLGFTLLIQSKAVALMEQINELDFTLGSTAAGVIAVGEGQLIEMHRLVHGKRPPWNRTGGSRDGKRWATQAPALLDVLAARRESLFVARRTVRELATDLRARLFEATIHASRMRAMMDAHEVGRLPIDGDQAVSVIEKALMLRDGRLVEDLDPSDEDIRRWLELLGDPDHWCDEAARRRAMLEKATARRPLLENERAVVALLDSVAAEAAPPAHIAATRDILTGGYLDEELVLL